jgi:hypothetical protein
MSSVEDTRLNPGEPSAAEHLGQYDQEAVAKFEAAFYRRAAKNIRRNSHHEAGHAVASVLLGLPLESVNVIARTFWQSGRYHPNADSTGSTSYKNGYKYFGSEKWYSKTEDFIVSGYAGPTAEHRYRGRMGPIRVSRRSGDWAVIEGVAFGRGLGAWAYDGTTMNTSPKRLDAYLRPLRARAADLVDQRWAAIQAVADALVKKRELNARQVKDIVRRHP